MPAYIRVSVYYWRHMMSEPMLKEAIQQKYGEAAMRARTGQEKSG
jgi:hypothetical protein